ncbi:hypothetical protein GCM10010469_58920 [Streptomyces labedae]|uniref:Uncharacterized protein n=1 Tax=Streptomyces labedae TaxID=285569 RepID=A0ABP6R4M9_9ACTN
MTLGAGQDRSRGSAPPRADGGGAQGTKAGDLGGGIVSRKAEAEAEAEPLRLRVAVRGAEELQAGARGRGGGVRCTRR